MSYRAYAPRRSAVGFAAILLAACTEPSALPPTEPAPPASQFALGPKGTRTVTTLEDPGTGDCVAQSCTLRQAIAIAQPGDRIIFKTNLSGRIVLTAGQLLIDKDLTIDGERRITVDANGASRVFLIGDDRNVTLGGLTITGGSVALPTPFPNGGGIRALANVTLTVRNSTIVGNSAMHGGGIVFNDGSLNVINSSVLSNRAIVQGGGIYNAGGLTTIVGSTIADNEAGPNGVTNDGGGLFNFGNSSVHGTMVIVNSTVSGNRAARGGAGIFSGMNAVLTIKHSTITNNHGGLSGGFWTHGPTMLTNTILGGNTGSTTPDCRSLFVQPASGGYNLFGSSACVLEIEGPGPGDLFLEDPADMLAVLSPILADNGGPTRTHALIEGGLAVDGGSCSGQSMDQRGLPRPFDHPGRANVADGCDIGAFEWLPSATKVK